ncbi:hypothetical protein JOF48_002550 [Arthrobacter stackebrandtii]|uniref:Uncharacterized protein n=1 Tax=Arthrobacter stackebrandtii TaxID=272161 RepID=A0ABS4YYD0_9MICC|nr:hypothetical protein [Arthrobacter stackebrandtii]
MVLVKQGEITGVDMVALGCEFVSGGGAFYCDGYCTQVFACWPALLCDAW